MKLIDVDKYDEELFTNLFDLTNKIKIRKICIELYNWLHSHFKLAFSDEDVKSICTKIEDKIKRSIFPNDVSCFI